jgi:hypothetical protein
VTSRCAGRHGSPQTPASSRGAIQRSVWLGSLSTRRRDRHWRACLRHRPSARARRQAGAIRRPSSSQSSLTSLNDHGLSRAHHLTGRAGDLGAALCERPNMIGLTVPGDHRHGLVSAHTSRQLVRRRAQPGVFRRALPRGIVNHKPVASPMGGACTRLPHPSRSTSLGSRIVAWRRAALPGGAGAAPATLPSVRANVVAIARRR